MAWKTWTPVPHACRKQAVLAAVGLAFLVKEETAAQSRFIMLGHKVEMEMLAMASMSHRMKGAPTVILT
jgi:hypothetical protein